MVQPQFGLSDKGSNKLQGIVNHIVFPVKQLSHYMHISEISHRFQFRFLKLSKPSKFRIYFIVLKKILRKYIAL